MKKLNSAESLITINHWRNILQSEGIACEIRNQHLGSIVGELPFVEVWPELWVVNALHYDRALQLISDDVIRESPAEAWICAGCKEENEGQFAACWNCGNTL
ncbi:MAG: DUF2007 domain-containing protein [Gammaproteobacteria bacterium]|nr:DUF2007 domain-containing protein [Gammaproteobacteria bacterium]MDH5303770.1 DUF2007 domain-containing protein [Gammaproteobacteria bacterium]MDH5323159.1 DUF2007 domain-containing protein [Gammaproteobacteria bacterium]